MSIQIQVVALVCTPQQLHSQRRCHKKIRLTIQPGDDTCTQIRYDREHRIEIIPAEIGNRIYHYIASQIVKREEIVVGFSVQTGSAKPDLP